MVDRKLCVMTVTIYYFKVKKKKRDLFFSKSIRLERLLLKFTLTIIKAYFLFFMIFKQKFRSQKKKKFCIFFSTNVIFR